MTVFEFRERMAQTKYIPGGSELHLAMHAFSQEALKITAELNGSYHTPEEVRALMSRLTASEIDETFAMFPPFHTDCGKNTKIGKRVFINAGCQFQDQGGIGIGDDVLVGPQTIIATLNHDPDPDKRGGMFAKPVVIGNKVWLGARVTPRRDDWRRRDCRCWRGRDEECPAANSRRRSPGKSRQTNLRKEALK